MIKKTIITSLALASLDAYAFGPLDYLNLSVKAVNKTGDASFSIVSDRFYQTVENSVKFVASQVEFQNSLHSSNIRNDRLIITKMVDALIDKDGNVGAYSSASSSYLEQWPTANKILDSYETAADTASLLSSVKQMGVSVSKFKKASETLGTLIAHGNNSISTKLLAVQYGYGTQFESAVDFIQSLSSIDSSLSDLANTVRKEDLTPTEQEALVNALISSVGVNISNEFRKLKSKNDTLAKRIVVQDAVVKYLREEAGATDEELQYHHIIKVTHDDGDGLFNLESYDETPGSYSNTYYGTVYPYSGPNDRPNLASIQQDFLEPQYSAKFSQSETPAALSNDWRNDADAALLFDPAAQTDYREKYAQQEVESALPHSDHTDGESGGDAVNVLTTGNLTHLGAGTSDNPIYTATVKGTQQNGFFQTVSEMYQSNSTWVDIHSVYESALDVDEYQYTTWGRWAGSDPEYPFYDSHSGLIAMGVPTPNDYIPNATGKASYRGDVIGRYEGGSYGEGNLGGRILMTADFDTSTMSGALFLNRVYAQNSTEHLRTLSFEYDIIADGEYGGLLHLENEYMGQLYGDFYGPAADETAGVFLFENYEEGLQPEWIEGAFKATKHSTVEK